MACSQAYSPWSVLRQISAGPLEPAHVPSIGNHTPEEHIGDEGTERPTNKSWRSEVAKVEESFRQAITPITSCSAEATSSISIACQLAPDAATTPISFEEAIDAGNSR